MSETIDNGGTAGGALLRVLAENRAGAAQPFHAGRVPRECGDCQGCRNGDGCYQEGGADVTRISASATTAPRKARPSSFAAGYQEALADVLAALDADGERGARAWITNNASA